MCVACERPIQSRVAPHRWHRDRMGAAVQPPMAEGRSRCSKARGQGPGARGLGPGAWGQELGVGREGGHDTEGRMRRRGLRVREPRCSLNTASNRESSVQEDRRTAQVLWFEFFCGTKMLASQRKLSEPKKPLTQTRNVVFVFRPGRTGCHDPPLVVARVPECTRRPSNAAVKLLVLVCMKQPSR